MRILFTITGPWGTGAATAVNGLSKALVKMGHEVKSVFPDLGIHSPDAAEYYGDPGRYHIIEFPAEFEGVEFYTFPLMITDPNPRNVANAWTYRDLTDDQFRVFEKFLEKRLAAVVEDFRPDMIETEHIWLMGYALRELGYKYVAAAHNSDQMGFRYDERMRPYATSCAEGAEYVFAISEQVKDDVLSLYGVDPGKVKVMPNGYDQEAFRPMEVDTDRLLAEYGISNDESLPIVTFAGKLSKTKGIDVLLAANAIAQERVPHILLIFGGGVLDDAIGREPRGDEMKNAHVVGQVTPAELAKFHNVARMSVLPSRREGFGIAVLEAMGCGLPVVATRTGCLEDFVVGEIVPPEDPEALAAAVCEMLELPDDKLESLGEQALAAARRYSWEDVARERVFYYREAIAKGRDK